MKVIIDTNILIIILGDFNKKNQVDKNISTWKT